MNTYTTYFNIACPANGLTVRYRLDIRTPQKIMVEQILKVCAELPLKAFHEELADRLARALPGRQILSAYHHGVEITTERGGA